MQYSVDTQLFNESRRAWNNVFHARKSRFSFVRIFLFARFPMEESSWGRRIMFSMISIVFIVYRATLTVVDSKFLGSPYVARIVKLYRGLGKMAIVDTIVQRTNKRFFPFQVVCEFQHTYSRER